MQKKKRKKKNKGNPFKTIFIGALLVGAFYFVFHDIWGKQTLKQDEEEEKPPLITYHNNQEIPTIEAGTPLVCSETDINALKHIPDALRYQIKSAPGRAEITISEIDNTLIGEQPLIYTLKTKDKHGNETIEYQEDVIRVIDTHPPYIMLKQQYMTINESQQSIQALLDNIKYVRDPVYGEFEYSSTLENGTYYQPRRKIPRFSYGDIRR